MKSDAISPSEAPSAGSASPDGWLRLSLVQRHGATRLQTLGQGGALRVLWPRPPLGEPLQAVLTNTAGGLVGGDRMTIDLQAGAGTRALVMAQAAEKVYRSTGADCIVETTVAVAEDALLEWLPQETILFQNARLRRRTRIEVADTARLLAGELLVLGREAHGERFTRGRLREVWEVYRAGRLVWADVLHLDGPLEELRQHPAALAGAGSWATQLYIGPDAADWLAPTRAWLEEQDPERLRVACGLVNGLLLVRWLGWNTLALRLAYGALWARWRARAGRPERLPRLWHI
ncbi:MAG: urease accessory protein UreD [Magnetococcales bacterium]|nr:urease accessory protein UreD [Magnetococcales bacterium]